MPGPSCFTALTTLPGREAAEALGAAMERLDPAPVGLGVFEVEDGSGLWEVGGYFEGAPDAVALALLSAAFGAAEFAVSELPDTDWVARVRRELSPVEAGRFFVHGSHDSGTAPPGSVALLVEASMAFGTGHHGSTLGCLRALDRLAGSRPPPARILDLGCGTAVLAMAAARAWPEAEVVAGDVDRVAVEVAEANLRANGLERRVRCVEAPGLDHPDLAGPFDLALANILKGPLLDLAGDIARAVPPGGVLVLSGLLADQAGEVAAAYSELGFRLSDRGEAGDWATLTFGRESGGGGG